MSEPSNNLTQAEAAARAALISDVHYTVHLDLNAEGTDFGSRTEATFNCREAGATTFIDFLAPAVKRAVLNGREIDAAAFDGGRLQLTNLAASNTLVVEGSAAYQHTGIGMHFFRDPVDSEVYLHTQFESNDAHRVFACFDQPDLKATHTFSVVAPDHWVVVSNTPGRRDDSGVWRFDRTKVISTYLAAIVAGPYDSVHADHGDIRMGLFCRRSMREYLEVEDIFEVTRQGLDYLAERLGVPYPFEKYDQLFCPEFSFGAMENPGCVTFNEGFLFRGRVTDAARERRADVILHEMSHMWFGDLVTMRWWGDLWLNESFATFMASYALVHCTRFKDAWLSFAGNLKAGARAQDELPTTHPIVADIPDIEAVHLNFDAITYNKGAAVMRQLAAYVGEEEFFRGLKDYFLRHAWGNTDLRDFLGALERSSGRDLEQWSRLWLEAAGPNTLSPELVAGADGNIVSLTVIQSASAEHPTLRPHRLRVGLYDRQGEVLERRQQVELDVDGPATEVIALRGEKIPALVLVNDGDLTYAKLGLDSGSIATAHADLGRMTDPLSRTLIWGGLWDMVRDARLRARDFLDIVLQHVDAEQDITAFQTLLGRSGAASTAFSAVDARDAALEKLAVNSGTALAAAAAGSDRQLIWSGVYFGSVRKAEDIRRLRRILEGEEEIPGLAIDVERRWQILGALVQAGAASPADVDAEMERDPTDAGRRHATSILAARQELAAKQAVLQQAIHDQTMTLATMRSAAGGFQAVRDEGLTDPLLEEYFTGLAVVWKTRTIDYALSYSRGFLPPHSDLSHAEAAITAHLEQDVPGPLRRVLLESRDGIRRTRAARACDAGASRGPAE